MSTRFSGPGLGLRCLLSLVFLLNLAFLQPAVAAESDKAEEETVKTLQPILVVNVASLNRSLNDIASMFFVSDRPDLVAWMDELLGEYANSLRGVEGTKPFGVMVFLRTDVLPPQPSLVAYIPVDNESEFIDTISLGPGTITKRSDHVYELARRRRITRITIQDNYAIIGEDEFVDRELPDPAEVAARLTARYDVSAMFQLKSLPSGMRNVFTTAMVAQASAELQQRDHESDEEYRARYAGGMSWLKLIEQILRDGQEVMLGIDSTDDGRRAVVELSVEAKPESEFAKFLTNLSGSPSYFQPLLSEQHPMQMSVSWTADEREKEMMRGWVEAGQIGVRRNLPQLSEQSLRRLVDPLMATIEAGHVDGIMQFQPEGSDRFIMVGGVRIVGEETFRAGLKEILTAVQLKRDETGEGPEITLDEHQTKNGTLHKIALDSADGETQRIYGGVPEIYLGVDQGAVWFASGKDGVRTSLSNAMAKTAAVTAGTRSRQNVPFQMIFHMQPWLSLPERENANPDERAFAMAAMDGSSDSLKIELQPRENGGTVRFQFEEGFVRMLGRGIGAGYDQYLESQQVPTEADE